MLIKSYSHFSYWFKTKVESVSKLRNTSFILPKLFSIKEYSNSEMFRKMPN